MVNLKISVLKPLDKFKYKKYAYALRLVRSFNSGHLFSIYRVDLNRDLGLGGKL